MFRANPQRTGVYNTTGVRQLRVVKWKLQKDSLLDFGSTVNNFRSSLVVVDQVLYFGSKDGNLYAVDVQTGREIWAFQLEAGISSDLVFHKGAVYINSSENYIYSIDVKTRRQK